MPRVSPTVAHDAYPPILETRVLKPVFEILETALLDCFLDLLKLLLRALFAEFDPLLYMLRVLSDTLRCTPERAPAAYWQYCVDGVVDGLTYFVVHCRCRVRGGIIGIPILVPRALFSQSLRIYP